MTHFKRSIRIGGLILILAIVFLGTALSGSGLGENLRFVFMADSRGKPINITVLNEINSRILALSPKPAFVIFAGDLATVGTNDDGSNNFQAFKNCMKPLTDAGIKLYVTLGNHELYKDGVYDYFFLENQRQYQQAFAYLPANGPPGYEKLVYSFESPGGDAFFAVLDPFYISPGTSQRPSKNDPGFIDERQLTWLRGQIAATQATHKFLCIHVPAYPVTSTTIQPSFIKLWSLLDKSGFDLYLCGHSHLYSRKTIDCDVDARWENGVVQLISGAAGAPPETAAIVRNRTAWHINVGVNYYSVVDISGSKVMVNSYGGKDGNYSLLDPFKLPPKPAHLTVR